MSQSINLLIITLLLASLLVACTAPVDKPACGTLSTVTVEGKSMLPLIAEDEEVNVHFNFHACADIKRDDIVLYHWAREENPLIKTVKAVPGDTLSLEPVNNKFAIAVNGELVTNSVGETYILSPYQLQVLTPYVNDYGEGLPEFTLLILGDNVASGADSRRFGLVSPVDVLGIVEK